MPKGETAKPFVNLKRDGRYSMKRSQINQKEIKKKQNIFEMNNTEAAGLPLKRGSAEAFKKAPYLQNPLLC